MPKYRSIEQLPPELNIRDLGGTPLKDGRYVRKGLIIRSSAPAFFTEEEMEPLRALHLKTILDFRSKSGSQKNPDPMVTGAAYYNKCAAFQNILDDLNSPADLGSLIFDEDQKGNAIDVLVSSYSASLAFSNESFRFMFECLLDGKAPLLFHCANGKDRTGVAAMLILLALGASEETVKADYLLSNINKKAEIDALMKKFQLISDLSSSARSLITMFEGVLPESADMMMTEILEKYGSYDVFMEREYGLDENKLIKLKAMYTTSKEEG